MSDTMDHASSALAIPPKSALPTVLAADQNDILGKLQDELAGFVPDATTEHGRKEIGSKARKVGTAKQGLIRLADTLKADAAKTVKSINAEVRVIEDRMDGLRDGILAPLEAFKQRERDRVAGHEAALADIAESPGFGQAEPARELQRRLDYLRAYPPRDWQEFKSRADAALAAEIARAEALLDAAVSREAEAEELARLRAEKEERDRIEAIRAQESRERQIAAEAAEAARVQTEAVAAAQIRAAEQRARAEQEAAAQRQREAEQAIKRAQEAAEQAERDRLAAVAKAEADARAAAQRAEAARIAAEAKAERDRLAAVEAERQRAASARAAEEAETKRREADKAHKAGIHRDILADLVEAGAEDALGRKIVGALAKGAVRHVSIRY